jgi:hypothetical protein
LPAPNNGAEYRPRRIRRQACLIPRKPGPGSKPADGQDQADIERIKAMAKGQMRQNKEKKKPKQDKEKKKGTSAYAQAYHAQTSNNPIGKKD